MRRTLALSLLAPLLLTACAQGPAPAEPSATIQPTPSASSAPAPTASAAPVPSAPPAASASAPAALPRTVVGLGDSIMAGTNCACDGPLTALADALERDHGVRPEVANLGVAGWTTDQLTRFVSTDADARTQLADADLVVVIIGANDLFRLGTAGTATANPAALPQDLATLSDRLGSTLAAVRATDDGTPARYLVTGYWDILSRPDNADPRTAAATAAVNATIAEAAADAGMTYVDLAGPFGDAGVAPLISDDGLHPNAEGVRVIGETLAGAVA